MSENRLNENEKTNKCNICLDNIRNEAKLDNCSHKFCRLCIVQWSQINNICPLCRQQFTKIICKRKTLEVGNNSNERLKKVMIICLMFLVICCLDEINISFY